MCVSSHQCHQVHCYWQICKLHEYVVYYAWCNSPSPYRLVAHRRATWFNGRRLPRVTSLLPDFLTVRRCWVNISSYTAMFVHVWWCQAAMCSLKKLFFTCIINVFIFLFLIRIVKKEMCHKGSDRGLKCMTTTVDSDGKRHFFIVQGVQ